MKKILLLLILHLVIFNTSKAQFINIKGTVKDAKDSANLPFASIQVKGKGVGTYSNEAGQFSLFISDTLKNDPLVISFVGYKSFLKTISSIDGTNIIFYLKEDNTVINEIQVVRDTSYKIVKKAFSLIKKNYPNQQFYSEGFYREMCLKDNKYTRLVEAAIGMQDFGFDADPERRKIQVLELRKSEDYIDKTWVSKTISFLFGKTNALLTSLDLSDFLRKYRNNPKLNPEDAKSFDEEYEFKLESIEKYNGEEIYVINVFLQAKKDVGQFSGKLLINKRDYGILKFEYAWGAPSEYSNSSDPQKRIVAKAYKNRFMAEYRKIDDKYYLSRFHTLKPVNFDVIDPELGEGVQFYNIDLIITNTFTRRKDFDRVKNKYAQKRELDLYEQEFAYNESFWKNYTILVSNPMIEKAKNDLGQDKKLEDQFESKGKKNND
jgi:CarboxypepD_reg-like domain